MQVAQVNSSAASALGQNQAEEASNRADDFARVLKTAVYGKGGEAVAKTTERAMSAAAPRTETRPVERTVERVSRERTDPTRPDSHPAPRETGPSQKPVESRAPSKADTQPPAKDAAAEAPAADQPATTEAEPQQDAANPVEQTTEPATESATQDAAGETAEAALPEEAAKPVVAEAPDAALILALLQTQVVPDAAGVVAQPAEAAVTTIVPTVPAVPAEDAAAAALAAVAEAQAKLAAPAQGETVAKDVTPADKAAAVVPQPATAVVEPQIKTATDTSATALLLQQQTVSAEDFAAIQQALTAQTQGQVQVQDQTGKPVVAADGKQKAEPKAEKSMTLDVQTVSATPKTLVDQAALLAMQGDDQAAADATLQQQQAQATQHQTQQQAAALELKFGAALLQAADEAAVQTSGNNATSNAGQTTQSAAAIGSTSTQATQTAQQAVTQTAARHLGAYIPAGEQVAVQIKKGVAEGVDKISIKLDPGNLGKVEIKLEIGHDGRLTAIVTADKPETLQLLQQDVKNLEQSLRDAGLKTDQQSLNFTLRDQNQASEGRDGNGAGAGRQRNRGGEEYAETGAHTDPAQLAAANAQRAAAARGGLDIRI